MAIGISVAAPIGPMGILCIRRSVAKGATAGLATGLGVATADAAFGAVAGFGLTTVSSLLVREQAWIAPVGGAFLCYLGLRSMRERPGEGAAAGESAGLAAAYASALALTLSNPATILSFVAVFAALGARTGAGYAGAGQFTAGIFLGSLAWWLFLSTAVGSARRHITPRVQAWINRSAGLALVLFGLWIVFLARAG